MKQLHQLREKDANWYDGRTFSLVYHRSDAHTQLLKDAYGLFFAENALNPSAFPSLRRMENEVVSMAAGLLGGDEQVCGSMTSGGSESLLMACKAYRDQARADKPHITTPEMIVAVSAHPALMKAAHYLGIRPIVVPVDADFRMDVAAVKQAIGPNTIFLVGSAPAYPQGVIDPIPELAALAQAHQLGLHVDACVGGFMLPFVRILRQQEGHTLTPFDFSVPGVTSMSADLHKYGFAAKGASVILHRTPEQRRHQFFVYAEWSGGLFASTTLLGTRPGGAIAAAWAALTSLGRQGYLEMTQGILATSRALQDGINQIPGLRVLGRPDMSVFAFVSDGPDLFAIGDLMELKGWHIDRQQKPSAIHLMITPAHKEIVASYLADLRASVEHVTAHPELASEGNAAFYGALSHIPEDAPERGMVSTFIMQHIEGLYRQS